MSTTPIQFQHSWKDGSFIYAHAAGTNIAYALGHEFTHPPLTHSKVAIYTWSQTSPAFIGRLNHIIKHWEDCVDIEVLPLSHHPSRAQFILHIPSYWYEFSMFQSFLHRVCLRLHKPSCRLYDFSDIYLLYFSTRDSIQFQPQSPYHILLVPQYQYSPSSSPYYNVKVLD
ncbi:hypothetical protein L210DRAFT_981797 [Boletus edulis BED1]|uniref:Uncharacterized protein n=1 Tax=Boletus edulis BED1 TaxID=1328754 RepID=A0AAD4BTL8_BOLED|nr:hypothetical protein L210DRAFT_981797 [Boletus edulis BED1]